MGNLFEEVSRLASRMTTEQVEQLTDEQILTLAMPRPGHPTQRGFLFSPGHFRDTEHLARAMHAFLTRLGKVK